MEHYPDDHKAEVDWVLRSLLMLINILKLMIRSLVFCGGGMKCLSYLGVYKALLEYDLIKDVDTLIATSAGTIIALMILLGYSLEELKDVYFNLDFSVLQDINPDRVFEFLDKFGLDSGINIKRMLQVLIRTKMGTSDCTFQELFQHTHKKFIVTGTSLNQLKCISFSHVTHPTMSVIDAIIISSSVPFVYQSHSYDGELYVDGGITNNYPICLSENLEETLGFLLWTESPYHKTIDNIITYSYSLMLAIYRRYMDLCRDLYEKYTVIIPVTTSCLNYKCSKEDKDKMYSEGYRCTKEYLESHRDRWEKSNQVQVSAESKQKDVGIQTMNDISEGIESPSSPSKK